MGGVAGAETTKKALRATASNGDGASVHPSEPQQQPAPLPAAAVAGNAADGSAAVHHQSCSEEDGQDDEQVERFYALLTNIRALWGLYSAGTRPAASGRGSRKRAREAETAPWMPAFRLEDFEEEVNQAADARCAVMNQGASGSVARRPAAAAATADDDHADDGVAEVERGGSKLGRRVTARG